MLKEGLFQVSCIIAMHNEEKNIIRCIDSILSQSHPVFEIIVINDNSSDNSERVVLDYISSHLKDERIRYYKNLTSLFAGGSRNRGAQLARGELLWFVEADAYYANDFLSSAAISFKERTCDGLGGGRRQSYESKTTIELFWDDYLDSKFEYDLAMKPSDTVPWIIRKTAFDIIGGFGESKEGEDKELLRKARDEGIKTCWAPLSTFWHRDPPTIKAFAKRYFDAGFNTYNLRKVESRLEKDLVSSAGVLFIFIFPILWPMAHIFFSRRDPAYRLMMKRNFNLIRKLRNFMAYFFMKICVSIGLLARVHKEKFF